jgi:hypothetical protein
LYVSQTGLGGAIINPGDGPTTSISVPLGVGIHTFHLFAQPFLVPSSFGLNLFLNADNSNPAISVFAAANGSLLGPFPPFFANSSTNTIDLIPNTVPAAGTLTFTDGQFQATLTDYRWSLPGVHNLDRVSFFGSDPNGSTDFVGQFTLEVTETSQVPEPSSLALAGIGVLTWIGVRARRRPRIDAA